MEKILYKSKPKFGVIPPLSGTDETLGVVGNFAAVFFL